MPATIVIGAIAADSYVIPDGPVVIGGALKLGYVAITSTYTINPATDYTINCTSGTFDVCEGGREEGV